MFNRFVRPVYAEDCTDDFEYIAEQTAQLAPDLRKALTPSAEQTFKDFKQSEYLRAALEEEVVNTHIHNDNLKVLWFC